MRAVSDTPPTQLAPALAAEGWALVRAGDLLDWIETSAAELAPLVATWDALPTDPHLRDGGHYRARRHASFLVDPGGEVTRAPHRAHFQPVQYNALHGGIERWFSPISVEVAEHPAWLRLLARMGAELARVTPVPRWFVEAHQFRVDTEGGIGRPTPEGAHRDGVDFVVVVVLRRHHIKGGETRVFEADGPNGVRFTLNEPWSTLVLDDRRVIHESTPIQPAGEHGHRDTLVLTYRAGGFQEAGSSPRS
ncbi:MAG: 2OG-Fe dioxygenase family protein [Minicystis sp.]